MVEIKQENPYKLPCKFYADPEFPLCIKHNGNLFRRTGKVGVMRATQTPAAEYSCNANRIWLDANNNITPE